MGDGNNAYVFIKSKIEDGVEPLYGFSQKSLTFCRNTSLARVPSWNVPFLTPIVQYGPVHQKQSFLGICPIHVWNTSMTFPILKKISLSPRCQSTNAFRHCCSCSRIAMLRTLSSLSSRSYCRCICSHYFSGRQSRICIHKLRTWN